MDHVRLVVEGHAARLKGLHRQADVVDPIVDRGDAAEVTTLRLDQHQPHTIDVEERHPGEGVQERHAEGVAVEGDGPIYIGDLDPDLPDLVEAEGFIGHVWPAFCNV